MHVRGHLRKGRPDRGAGIGRPGARLEAVRAAPRGPARPGPRSACRGSARPDFRTRFPFATVTLHDKTMPLDVEITGWSPFEPGDADASSLPVAALEYRFTNTSAAPVEAVFSWNARSFLAPPASPHKVQTDARRFCALGRPAKDKGKPDDEATFSATVNDPAVKVNHAWFRGGLFDPLTIAWKDIADGACYDRPPVSEGGPSPAAATLFVPLTIPPGSRRPSSCVWHGMRAGRISASARTCRASRHRAPTNPGMRAVSATSAK